MDALIAETVAEAVRDGDIGRLRDLSVMLPLRPHIEQLRLALADQLDQEDDASEIERQLLELLGSTDPEMQSAATARLLRLYLQAGEASAIPALSARLSGPFADRPSLDGRTGAELLDVWNDDETFHDLLHPTNIWPMEHVETGGARRALPPLYAVKHLGPPSETLRDWRFHVDMTGTTLQAYDGQGADRWHVPIGQSSNRRGQSGFGYARHVRTQGRLVLMVTNDAFFVLDALADDGEPRVLVNEQLNQFQERAATFMARFQVQIRPGVNPRGGLRNQVRVTNGQANGNVGPILGSSLIYQRGSTIRAIDPLTGDVQWQRESPEIPAGAEIMADDDFVVVWPANRDSVLVLRAADGATVKHTNLPRGVLKPQPDGDWERCVVVESREQRQGERTTKYLSLFDPVSEDFRWELPFEDVIDWAVVDGRDLALLREGGQFTLIDGLTGDERFSWTLDDPDAQAFSVDRFHDQLLVMTASEPSLEESEKNVQPWSDLDFPMVHGQAALLNLEDGQPVWSRRIEHQTYVRNLPGRWPLLAFAASVFERGREPVENYTAILLLNRSTGEVLHEATWDRSANKFGWLSRPDRHRLELSFGLESVSLQFNASPTEPTEDDPDESSDGDSSE